MTQHEVGQRMRLLRAAGWVPNRLACERRGRLVEIMSYPFPSDDGESILIYGRSTPGDPTTNALWVLVGERIRETDEKDTGLRNLRIVPVICPNCKHKWGPKCSGEFLGCHIDCPNCHYTYTAVYDNTNFVGFRFHGEMLKVRTKKWT